MTLRPVTSRSGDLSDTPKSANGRFDTPSDPSKRGKNHLKITKNTYLDLSGTCKKTSAYLTSADQTLKKGEK